MLESCSLHMPIEFLSCFCSYVELLCWTAVKHVNKTGKRRVQVLLLQVKLWHFYMYTLPVIANIFSRGAIKHH